MAWVAVISRAICSAFFKNCWSILARNSWKLPCNWRLLSKKHYIVWKIWNGIQVVCTKHGIPKISLQSLTADWGIRTSAWKGLWLHPWGYAWTDSCFLALSLSHSLGCKAQNFIQNDFDWFRMCSVNSFLAFSKGFLLVVVPVVCISAAGWPKILSQPQCALSSRGWECGSVLCEEPEQRWIIWF